MHVGQLHTRQTPHCNYRELAAMFCAWQLTSRSTQSMSRPELLCYQLSISCMCILKVLKNTADARAGWRARDWGGGGGEVLALLDASQCTVPCPKYSMIYIATFTGPSGVAMVVRAVAHHLGLLVQQPLLSALRPLLQNFPQLLLRAAHSGSPETAAGLFGQLQYQIQQVFIASPFA